jgi:hypothetical protein
MAHREQRRGRTVSGKRRAALVGWRCVALIGALLPAIAFGALRYGHTLPLDGSYLDLFRQRPGVIAHNSGVLYEVLEEGLGGQPLPNDHVRVRYRGTLVTGEAFGQSGGNADFATAVEFPMQRLIPGLQAVLPLMRRGAHWLIVVPGSLGFPSGNPLFRRTTVYDLTLEDFHPDL